MNESEIRSEEWFVGGEEKGSDERFVEGEEGFESGLSVTGYSEGCLFDVIDEFVESSMKEISLELKGIERTN